jgi:Uma2 family endonuclease
MVRAYALLLQRLLRTFERTSGYAQQGLLMTEVDMFLPCHNRTRRPDIAYLTSEQMAHSHNGELTVCPFVVEIVSKNDKTNEVDQKLIEYFANGVEVVWLIFPQVKKVEVYRSLRDVTICYEADVCSAAPVLPDFSISVNELLA